MNKLSSIYREGNEHGELRVEYWEGVVEFLNFAFSREHLVQQETIRCPCKRCGNMNWENQETITFHRYVPGFMRRYYAWTVHGELPQQPLSDNAEMLNNNSSLHDIVYDIGQPTLADHVGCESDVTHIGKDQIRGLGNFMNFYKVLMRSCMLVVSSQLWKQLHKY